MPQVDIFNFSLQILIIMIVMWSFYFVLDKYLLYFIFDIKKLQNIIINFNDIWCNFFYKYIKLLKYNNLYFYFINITSFLINIIKIFYLIIYIYNNKIFNNIYLNNILKINKIFLNYNIQKKFLKKEFKINYLHTIKKEDLNQLIINFF